MISQSTYRFMAKAAQVVLLAAACAAFGGAARADGLGLSFGNGAAALPRVQGYVSRPLYDASSDQDNARNAVKAGNILSLEQILPRVRARYPGQHLDSRLVQAGGRAVYKVKMRMKDGSVKIVTVDARSGNILGAR